VVLGRRTAGGGCPHMGLAHSRSFSYRFVSFQHSFPARFCNALFQRSFPALQGAFSEYFRCSGNPRPNRAKGSFSKVGFYSRGYKIPASGRSGQKWGTRS